MTNRKTIPLQPGHFDYRFKRQASCPSSYARVIGYLEPCQEAFIFENRVQNGDIPPELIPACEQGFREEMKKGTLGGFPVTGVKVVLTGGDYHMVDSNHISFRIASRLAFRQAYATANPVILEPWMKIWVNTPTHHYQKIQQDLYSRRGHLIQGNLSDRLDGEVPLREMLGYREQLRSLTSGEATFAMSFSDYRQVPQMVREELLQEV